MPGENRQLIELLDAEFERFRSTLSAEKQGRYRTVKDMAGFLKIDAALLSRLRGGDRPVNERMAMQFAQQFYPNNETEIKVLVAKLLSAKAPRDDADKAVEKWFEERGASGFFLGVAFFEPPALRKNDEPGRAVAAAVAKGMSYTILYPFSQSQSTNRQLPEPLQDYLRKVWRGIRGLYAMLLSTALEIKREEWQAGNRQEDLEAELSKAAGRVRVYEVVQGEGTLGGYSAVPVGYRLFYTCDHRGSKPVRREIWQWNTTSAGYTMLQRHAEDFEKEAVEALMYPLPQFFERSFNDPGWKLPDNEDLQKFIEDDPITVAAWNLPKSSRWKLASMDNISVQDVIDHELVEAGIKTATQNAPETTGGRP